MEVERAKTPSRRREDGFGGTQAASQDGLNAASESTTATCSQALQQAAMHDAECLCYTIEHETLLPVRIHIYIGRGRLCPESHTNVSRVTQAPSPISPPAAASAPLRTGTPAATSTPLLTTTRTAGPTQTPIAVPASPATPPLTRSTSPRPTLAAEPTLVSTPVPTATPTPAPAEAAPPERMPSDAGKTDEGVKRIVESATLLMLWADPPPRWTLISPKTPRRALSLWKCSEGW